jgi:Fe-S cluster assembly protein SufD
MSTTQLTTLKENAKQHFAELNNPSFRYGLGIHVQPDNLEYTQVPDDSLTIIKANGSTIIEGHDEQNSLIGSLVKSNNSKILANHYSKIKKSYHIIIPEKTRLERPVIFVSNKGNNRFEQIFIDAKAGSNSKVLIKVNNPSEFTSQVIEVLVGQKANLEVQLFHDSTNTSNNFCTRGFKVLGNGSLIWTDVIVGGNFTQVTSHCELAEEGAKFSKHTASFSESTTQLDLFDSVTHVASHTESNILSRSVVDQKSKTIYRGKIHVSKQSKSCSSHQKSENLLLSREARCNAVPILEINNDDISCSHGASFTNIDSEQLFYLNSRGLANKLARNMIISGFIEPMIQNFCLDQTQDHIRERLGEKTNG